MSSAASMESTTAESVIAAFRPWAQFFDLPAFNLPVSLSESTARITRNLFYFRVNYALVALLILFLSLLWHPVSMIVFLIVFVAWFFLYFFRNVPLTVFGYTVDDRVVLAGLGIVTVSALLMAGVWVNVIVSLVMASALICVHGALRGTEDLVGDDHASPYNALLSVVDDPSGAYGQI
uniref:PRA1 family protein n=1 Tax=Kalanchoe fedtschenkoi TaxID=63787 RepID=A0A7N0UUK1_KALFE